MKRQCILFVVVAILLVGCASQTKRLNKSDTPYDMACKLSYILRTMMRSGEVVTPQMEVYLNSRAYQYLPDPVGQELFEKVFTESRKALSEKEAFLMGQLVAKAQFSLVKAGLYYRFTEFVTVDEKGILASVFFSGLNALAERGKYLW